VGAAASLTVDMTVDLRLPVFRALDRTEGQRLPASEVSDASGRERRERTPREFASVEPGFQASRARV